MDTGYSWALKGQPNTRSTKVKGKRITFLGAISIYGLESFILVEGAVN